MKCDVRVHKENSRLYSNYFFFSKYNFLNLIIADININRLIISIKIAANAFLFKREKLRYNISNMIPANSVTINNINGYLIHLLTFLFELISILPSNNSSITNSIIKSILLLYLMLNNDINTPLINSFYSYVKIFLYDLSQLVHSRI